MTRRHLGRRSGTIAAVTALALVGAAAAYAAGLGLTSSGLGTFSDDNVSIPKFATTLSATAVPTSAPVGTDLLDRAVLSGATTGAEGTITYRLYGPDDATCAGTPATVIQTVTGPKSYDSPTVRPTAAGTYRWTAGYSGDSRNTGATTACADAGQAVTLTEAGFSATALRLLNGLTGTAGKPETGDRVEIDFGAAVTASSVCSTWSGAAPLTVTVRLSDQSVTSVSNDQLTFEGCNGALSLGVVDLGTASFYNGGGQDKSATWTALLSRSVDGRTLTVTFGTGGSKEVNEVKSVFTATLTPAAALRSGSAAIGGAKPTTGSVVLF